MPKSVKSLITSFDFPAGRILAKKYEVLSRLGSGWEGEVYPVVRDFIAANTPLGSDNRLRLSDTRVPDSCR